jgi:hypothetical protein
VHKQLRNNDKAIAAFQKYLELNKGKDGEGEKRVKDELGSMGGSSGKKDPPKTPPKKK